MPSYPDDVNANITPKEFEELVHEHLSNLGQELKTFTATHDIKLLASDGEYQIDVYVEFEYLGVTFKVLVECKRHKNKIKRETVQILNDKLKSLGAHKGMIFSTNGFQEGAYEYANIHGIALIRVIEGRFTYYTKSQQSENFNPPSWFDIPKYVGEYKQGTVICNLSKGYFEPLQEFLFPNS
jgi:restriction system protein